MSTPVTTIAMPLTEESIEIKFISSSDGAFIEDWGDNQSVDALLMSGTLKV